MLPVRVQCLDYEDPISKLRASLAMFFFALCVMALCLQVRSVIYTVLYVLSR